MVESCEQSQWLIDIAHDICDPALKRGSLQMWVAAGEMWRDVNPTDPLTTSTYLYDVQDVVSLSKISECTGKSKTSASGNMVRHCGSIACFHNGEPCQAARWTTMLGDKGYCIVTNSHVCPK